MHFRMTRLNRLGVAALLCGTLAAAPVLAETSPAPAVLPAKTSLTATAIPHTVECPNPKRELCVIRKPVGSGYRLLTQGITLEDSGEYWLIDFTKAQKEKQPSLSRVTFRVMGKDNDIHEIEIAFPADDAAKATPASSAVAKAPRKNAKATAAKQNASGE